MHTIVKRREERHSPSSFRGVPSKSQEALQCLCKEAIPLTGRLSITQNNLQY